MIIRAAAAGDMEAIRSIASTYGNLAHWPARPDYLDFELESASLAVCEIDRVVAGFGAVIERGGVAHLADLFVRPDRLGLGIGSALLKQLMPAQGERVTFASQDPRAVPLYSRFGMLPIAPLNYLTGSTQASLRLEDLDVRLIDAEPAALANLDRVASSRERRQDFEFLARVGAHCFLARQKDEVVGYGVCRLVDGALGAKHAYLGPVGGRGATAAAATCYALLRWAAGRGADARMTVFGPNRALPALLSAGFRIEDTDLYMSSREDLIDLHQYFPSADLG